MTHLEAELEQLKEAILEMTNLVRKQLKKAGKAFVNADDDLAEEIIHKENRVNALELSINRDCENILALFSPVATDLRFVLAMLNTASELERMGDYAKGIANYTLELEKSLPNELLEEIELKELFTVSIQMIEEIYSSLEKEDSTIARKIFKQDKVMNRISDKSTGVITEFIQKNPELTKPALLLFSTVRRVERFGDRAKNLAEDIIFYLEAEILKHSKKNKA